MPEDGITFLRSSAGLNLFKACTDLSFFCLETGQDGVFAEIDLRRRNFPCLMCHVDDAVKAAEGAEQNPPQNQALELGQSASTCP
jgi:hypothetical protein